MSSAPRTALALRSRVTPDRTVEVSLVEIDVPPPGPDEVLVRVEAAPINPSDLGVLFADADLERAEARGSGENATLVAPLSAGSARAASARVGRALPAGNEGVGAVVAAGESAAAKALLGKVVGVVGGGIYSQLRRVGVESCLAFPEGTTAAQAAAWFVNPMTAMAMLATMRGEGHTALIHTAATSSLGAILLRLCLADGVTLVNIVRRPEGVRELRAAGAEHVCDSSSENFAEELEEVVAATGATLAFDAVGGGSLADSLLTAMERAAARDAQFDRYGTAVHKQVYLYGGLDRGPTELRRAYGMSWGVGGWLLGRRLEMLGSEAVVRVRERVVTDLHTTFKTSYAKTLSLSEALIPDTVRAYGRAGTGQKHLIDPSRA